MRSLIALLVAAAAGAAQAQQAGDNVVAIGWVHVATRNVNGSLHTDLQPGVIGNALGIPDSFDSADTIAGLGRVNTLGLSFTRFLSDHLTADLVGGIPARVSAYGQGVVSPPGVAGRLFNVDLGDPAVNPLGSARQWSPSLLLQYHFAGTHARLRPFFGVGATYTWFTQVRLSRAFEDRIAAGVGRDLALAAGKPGPTTVSARTRPLWAPVFSAGLPLSLGDRWGITASLGYVPFATHTLVQIHASDGSVLSSSQARIGVDALVSGLLLAYRF